MTHDDMLREGFGVRAQTQSRSSAYRAARQARAEGKLARVIRSEDGWYTVWSMEVK